MVPAPVLVLPPCFLFPSGEKADKNELVVRLVSNGDEGAECTITRALPLLGLAKWFTSGEDLTGVVVVVADLVARAVLFCFVVIVGALAQMKTALMLLLPPPPRTLTLLDLVFEILSAFSCIGDDCGGRGLITARWGELNDVEADVPFAGLGLVLFSAKSPQAKPPRLCLCFFALPLPLLFAVEHRGPRIDT